MKQIGITFTILLTATLSLFAANTPEVLFDDKLVEIVSFDGTELFESADFNSASDNLMFTTTKDISLIQIFDQEGNLEFQLPVMSNDVKINKNLFGSGVFKLGFMLEGQTEIVFTQVTIK